MAERDMKRMLEWKIRDINKILELSGQKLYMEPHNPPVMDGEEIFTLKWDRPISDTYVSEEHVFSGSEFELFCNLNGIEFGIRMMRMVKASEV